MNGEFAFYVSFFDAIMEQCVVSVALEMMFISEYSAKCMFQINAMDTLI